MVCLAACAASLALGGTTAAAQAVVEPLPIGSASPEDGAVIPARPAGLGESSWTLTSIPGLRFVSVRVTLTPATGTDGVRLSDTDTKQFCVLEASGTEVGVYEDRGCTSHEHASWTTIPGTYYWQITAESFPFGEALIEYASPIFTITVARSPPPPSPMQATHAAPARRRCPAGHNAKIGGRSTCLRSGARCRLRYRHQYARHHYACLRRGGHHRLVRR
jgi:hypothetical protein